MDKLNVTYEYYQDEDAESRLSKIFEFLLKDVEEDHGNIRQRSPLNNT